MASRMILTLIDFDRDKQQVSFEGDTSAAGTYAADLAAAEALADAIEAITLGARVSRSFVADVDEVDPVTTPANPFAQTNIQWVFEYKDNVTGNDYTKRVGTADLSAATGVINGRPYLTLASGAGATLKTAFEAFVLSPDGNAVTLEGVFFYE